MHLEKYATPQLSSQIKKQKLGYCHLEEVYRDWIG